ncbi:hypothetical protein D3C78_1378610 [compost metagenome]
MALDRSSSYSAGVEAVGVSANTGTCSAASSNSSEAAAVLDTVRTTKSLSAARRSIELYTVSFHLSICCWYLAGLRINTPLI